MYYRMGPRFKISSKKASLMMSGLIDRIPQFLSRLNQLRIPPILSFKEIAAVKLNFGAFFDFEVKKVFF